MEFIEIDGSIGEGGGQILRTAMSLSGITLRPVRITKIRAGRKEPGLRPQHLQAVLSAASVCNGSLRGAEVGSTNLEYIPRQPQALFQKRIDTGTAGSVSLIAQTIIPISIFSNVELDVQLIGGTEVPNSPTIDYIVNVVKPVYEKLGANLQIVIERRGYYPRGGGVVEIRSKPAGSYPENLELVAKSQLLKDSKVSILSVARSLPDHVSKRQADSARAVLEDSGLASIEGRVDSSGPPSLSPGSSLLVFSKGDSNLVGASSLGERGKRAELVGEEAGKKYIRESSCNPGVDSHLADMLVTLLPCMKKSGKPSVFTTPEITQHLNTNIEIVRKFIPDCNFDLIAPNGEGNDTGCWKVAVSR